MYAFFSTDHFWIAHFAKLLLPFWHLGHHPWPFCWPEADLLFVELVLVVRRVSLEVQLHRYVRHTEVVEQQQLSLSLSLSLYLYVVVWKRSYCLVDSEDWDGCLYSHRHGFG